MDLLVITGILINMLIPCGKNHDNIVSKMFALNEKAYLESVENSFKRITVDVTAYSPRRGETDSTPFTTASNKRVNEGYIAISRDLEVHLSFGDKVFIKDIGIFEVQDRMNRRWEKRVDLFFFDTKQAKRFGKVKKEMWILDSKKSKLSLAKD